MKLVDNKCTRSTSQRKTEKNASLVFCSLSLTVFLSRYLWITNGLKIEIIEYLTVADDVILNQRKDKRYWRSTKVSASKTCNELNHTKMNPIKNPTALTLLLLTMNNLIDKRMNVSDDVWCNWQNNQ